MKTIGDLITLSKEYLEKRNIANPRLQAENLLSDALGMKRIDLYLDFHRPLQEGEIERCRTFLKRRGEGEPLQYIYGSTEFFGATIQCNKKALIPRQETELLVEKIANFLKTQDLKGKVIWDICCGTGCIGIALKKQFPKLKLFLADLSPEALSLAKENCEKNQVEATFLQGDFLEPFEGKQADFIVCNPPYIAEEEWENLEKEVKNFEPKMALVANDQGKDFYKKLSLKITQLLKEEGRLWMEIGYQQGEDVVKIFSTTEGCSLRYEKDLSGHDRFFFLEKQKNSVYASP